jgi:hypothetical protein
MVSGSESEDTAFLLALEIEYIRLAVKSILKNRVMPAIFTSTTMTK